MSKFAARTAKTLVMFLLWYALSSWLLQVILGLQSEFGIVICQAVAGYVAGLVIGALTNDKGFGSFAHLHGLIVFGIFWVPAAVVTVVICILFAIFVSLYVIPFLLPILFSSGFAHIIVQLATLLLIAMGICMILFKGQGGWKAFLALFLLMFLGFVWLRAAPERMSGFVAFFSSALLSHHPIPVILTCVVAWIWIKIKEKKKAVPLSTVIDAGLGKPPVI